MFCFIPILSSFLLKLITVHPNQISNHPGLLSAGAALELATVMQRESDPYRRINATMAVALLVGHEEQHPLMRIDERGLREMLMVLACSRAKVMCHGYFWTCWKASGEVGPAIGNHGASGYSPHKSSKL